MSVLVRNAWHAVGMARTAEALLVAAGLGLITAAAAVAEGIPLRDPVNWGLALAAGVAVGLSWFVDLHPRADVLARKIDRTLRLDGALLTAWELESSGTSSPIGALLARRVRQRVRPSEAVRAALPLSGPILAVPFLGAAVLAWVCGLHADDGEVHIRPALGAMVAALGDAERVAQEELAVGAMSAADLQELAALTRRARELAAESDSAGNDPAALRRELGDLAERIEEFAQDRATRTELSRELDRAGVCADAAREGLKAAANEAEDRSPTEETVAGSDSGAAEAGTAGAADDGSGGEGAGHGAAGGAEGELGGGDLALGEANGTMVALPNAEEATPGAPDPATGGGEVGFGAASGPAGGVALDRWWPARHAALAGRWVESRRARAEESATTSNQDSD